LLRANFRVIYRLLVHTLVDVALSRSPANNHVIYQIICRALVKLHLDFPRGGVT